MIQNAGSKITEIKAKVQKLISLHHELNEKFASVQKENAALKQIVADQSTIVKELKDRNQIISVTGSSARNQEETQELRTKVNGLIREIDKCVSLLNA